VGRGDAAVVREWETLCKTAKLHPEVFWSARTVYLRYVRWSGELVPGGQDAVERLRDRRIRAHICAELTLHLNKRKARVRGDEHPGCCLGQCKRTAQLALGV
jgi:hypothetical protein